MHRSPFDRAYGIVVRIRAAILFCQLSLCVTLYIVSQTIVSFCERICDFDNIYKFISHFLFIFFEEKL